MNCHCVRFATASCSHDITFLVLVDRGTYCSGSSRIKLKVVEGLASLFALLLATTTVRDSEPSTTAHLRPCPANGIKRRSS